MGEFEGARFHYAKRRLEAQRAVALNQVRMARRFRLPLIVQIHPQEEAELKMAEVLVEGLGEGSDLPILLSCFHGRPKFAATMLRFFPNLVVAFSGLLTFKKLQDKLGETAFDVPMSRFVLESLGPRFPPAGLGGPGGRGGFSHPAHIDCVAAELAIIKKVTKLEVLEAAWANVSRLFKLAERSQGKPGDVASSEPCRADPAEESSEESS